MPKQNRAAVCLAAIALLASALPLSAEPENEKLFRVCADPNNLPFSNQAGQGFENKLAELIAADLGKTVSYTWWAQRRGNIRNTLKAGACDVIMGVPADLDMVATTRPYYRSTYVFVTRPEHGAALASLKDPALKTLKVGVQLVGDDGFNTPPALALAMEGIVNNVRGYTLYGDYREENPPARIIDAVRNGEVDVAAVWGPLAGYFASRGGGKLTITPIANTDGFAPLRFQFDIAIGVRKGDKALRAKLDQVVEKHQADVTGLLRSYGVPLIEKPAAVQPVSAIKGDEQ